jgi:hypothetical protein
MQLFLTRPIKLNHSVLINVRYLAQVISATFQPVLTKSVSVAYSTVHMDIPILSPSFEHNL